MMHRSHVPIQEWFWAAYLLTTLTPGISALQLQRQLGLGSCATEREGQKNPPKKRPPTILFASEFPLVFCRAD